MRTCFLLVQESIQDPYLEGIEVHELCDVYPGCFNEAKTWQYQVSEVKDPKTGSNKIIGYYPIVKCPFHLMRYARIIGILQKVLKKLSGRGKHTEKTKRLLTETYGKITSLDGSQLILSYSDSTKSSFKLQESIVSFWYWWYN